MMWGAKPLTGMDMNRKFDENRKKDPEKYTKYREIYKSWYELNGQESASLLGAHNNTPRGRAAFLETLDRFNAEIVTAHVPTMG
jgi:hypothetical protein